MNRFNPIALRMAKTLQSFGRSECNWIICQYKYNYWSHSSKLPLDLVLLGANFQMSLILKCVVY